MQGPAPLYFGDRYVRYAIGLRPALWISCSSNCSSDHPCHARPIVHPGLGERRDRAGDVSRDAIDIVDAVLRARAYQTTGAIDDEDVLAILGAATCAAANRGCRKVVNATKRCKTKNAL
jgi:hypothetical protein